MTKVAGSGWVFAISDIGTLILVQVTGFVQY
jgi:hypothetical protein